MVPTPKATQESTILISRLTGRGCHSRSNRKGWALPVSVCRGETRAGGRSVDDPTAQGHNLTRDDLTRRPRSMPVDLPPRSHQLRSA